MAFQLENLRGLGKGLNSSALRLGVRSLHGPPKANEYVETAVYPKISVSSSDLKEEKNTNMDCLKMAFQLMRVPSRVVKLLNKAYNNVFV